MADSACFFVLFYIFFLTATDGQIVPPRLCVDTGITCHEDCSLVPDPTDYYQWCGGCKFYIACVGDTTYYQPCAASLYWHDNDKSCEAVSTTCLECVMDTTPVDSTATTTQETPPVPPLCTSTGPGCIDDCDVTHNGIYQWCARCDFFLLCSGSADHHMPCVPNTYYDDITKACEHESSTCFECHEGLTTPSINPCIPNPCVTGICMPSDGGYTCVCDADWTGDLCQTPIPCFEYPCLNGGTCNPEDDSCTCPPGYTGPDCGDAIPCFEYPCLNGGTCNPEDDSCTCPPGYTGPDCGDVIGMNPCLSLPCINEGTCNEFGNYFNCTCPIGFTGVLCESRFTCDPDPCLNGGTCHDSGIETEPVYCECSPEYTGYRCESENYNVSTVCGSRMGVSSFPPTNGFTQLCEFENVGNDPSFQQTACRDFLQDLPVYGNGNGLLAGGGDFGCWITNDANYPINIQQSCFTGFQQNHTLGQCFQCTHMIACLLYPY